MQIKCKKISLIFFKSTCFRPSKSLQRGGFAKKYQTNHLCQTDCLTTEIISEEITYKDKNFDIKLKPIFQIIVENQYNLV